MGEQGQIPGIFNPKSYFWVIIALMIILYARFVMFTDDHPVWKTPTSALSRLLR